jgi:hypothetical protein
VRQRIHEIALREKHSRSGSQKPNPKDGNFATTTGKFSGYEIQGLTVPQPEAWIAGDPRHDHTVVTGDPVWVWQTYTLQSIETLFETPRICARVPLKVRLISFIGV